MIKGSTIAAGAFAAVLLFVSLAGYRALNRPAPRPAATPPTAPSQEEPHPSMLYGRIATVDGVTYEGRLRWGGSQEALWGNYFNGARFQNPWAVHVPPERLPSQRRPVEIFGIQVGEREHPIDLGRLFMVRFGDIARVQASTRHVQVTLKSGTVFDLDRFNASDFDDGVRVWDRKRGTVDLDTLRIRAIDFLPAPVPGAAPNLLHGTVTTRHGGFTGLVQWDREQCIGSDRLNDGERSLPFDTIRSIERRSPDSSLVTLAGGSGILLSGTREVGRGNRGVYVDDPRYGRVLISWDAFERVDFSPAGNAPAYADFPPGGPLTGTIATRAGRRLTGRLVFDLDESEVTETLDAPAEGVNYTIPFGLIASVQLPRAADGAARVTLHSGEELLLERAGDLGEANAGMLVFIDGQQRPEYVPWAEVEQVYLNRPTAMYPLGANKRP